MRRILREKIEEDEPKIIKVVKKYYQKCVNSIYVRTEGKAEFKSLLYEYGKFPIFEDNWKSSNFNVTKALILDIRHFLYISKRDKTIHFRFSDKESLKKETTRNAFKFDFYLSGELTSEISNDFFGNFNAERKIVAQRYDFVPIHKMDEFMNITSGLDWLEIIKHRTNDKNISNDTLVTLVGKLKYFRMYDLENRRKLANFVTIRFLLPKLNYFAVYPVPQYITRSKNRYEICIEDMRTFVNFPLEIMFQLKYGNETVSKAFKEFYQNVLRIQLSVRMEDDDDLKDLVPNPTIIVGFPDELTSPEFLNKLYANFTLKEDEGLYKMFHQLYDYKNVIKQEGNNSIALENLSENAKEIYKTCGGFSLIPYELDKCKVLDNSIVFKVINTLFPLFHPQRPYYVNLAYYSAFIDLIDFRKIDVQKHYLKYVDDFGSEQNLPGFLMTNEQMLEMIRYQTECYKIQDGRIGSYINISKSIFNCPVDEEKKEEEE